ncbi:TIGR00730 family Rossman fold protein [bacterium]|nr:MAG: TIGR00730 family Rossman fold protein [bacterium]
MPFTPHKWITVFCGSSGGFDSTFTETAAELGSTLASKQMGLVYGGASIGVMGAIANGFLKQNAPVIGVIPTVLKTREVAHFHLTELIEVSTMHERKAIMMEKADAFVALPGGVGTLEELFEVITWRQLNIHQKPVFIFNQDGFYDSLIQLLEDMISKGFIRPENRNLYEVHSSLETLTQSLEQVPVQRHNSHDFDIV